MALGEEQQERWLSVYNKTGCSVKAWNSVEDVRRIEFIANAETIDSQSEEIKQATLLKAMPQFIKAGGPLIDSHSNRIIGTVYDYEAAISDNGYKAVKCRAAVYRGQKVYDELWKEIKYGRKTAVSIGGDPLRKSLVCTDRECHREISDIYLMEISVTDDPANPEAVITAANFTAKSKQIPEESGKELENMSEEEQPAQAPPEEENVQKDDLPEPLKQFMAMVTQRLEALESKKDEPPVEPVEDETLKEEPEKCNKSRTDEILEVRKDMEKTNKSKNYGKTPMPGSAEGTDLTKEIPTDGRLMKTRELEALIRGGY